MHLPKNRGWRVRPLNSSPPWSKVRPKLGLAKDSSLCWLLAYSRFLPAQRTGTFSKLVCFSSPVTTSDIIQNGVACLTALVKKDSGQVLAWSDGAGQGGLDYILRILGKLLQSADESGGLNVGELIITIFRKAGNAVLPVLPELLQAMITRMTTARTASFLQVCLTLFVQLAC